MLSSDRAEKIVQRTFTIAKGLGAAHGEPGPMCLAQIASALIIADGMQAVSDIGPALEKISTALEKIADAGEV